MCRINALVLLAGLMMLGGFVFGCKSEERISRVDPQSASAVDAARELPPRPQTTQPVTIDSDRPVKHDYEQNSYAISEGQRLYRAFNCVGCHSHGGGGIGPALMDNTWIHGSDPEIIFGGIVDGWPNGMPAYRGKIPDYQVWELVAYVRSLGGLTPSVAAPGRSDEMSSVVPPNSADRARPRISTRQREELEQREKAEFARRGWLDPASGKVRIPYTIVREVSRLSAPPTHRAIAPASERRR